MTIEDALKKAIFYVWNDENWELVDEFKFRHVLVKKLRNHPYIRVELRRDNEYTKSGTVCLQERLYEITDSELRVTNSEKIILKICRESL